LGNRHAISVNDQMVAWSVYAEIGACAKTQRYRSLI